MLLERIKKLIGLKPSADFSALVKEGAMILDVRTSGEFASGHINGSVNIPVDQITRSLSKLKNHKKAIITCCESGMRSASAKEILKANGFTEVYNGGGWRSLQKQIRL